MAPQLCNNFYVIWVFTTTTTQGKMKSKDPMNISIIGSGDFGRALALRMVQSGFTVCIGSRNPNGHTK